MQTIIIGAGVLGASAAYHLARAGAPVTIADADLDGRATAAGAGIICPWVSGVQDEAFYRLYAAGGEYYGELVEQLAESGETDLGYRRVGAMLVSRDPEELAWIERYLLRRQAASPAMGDVNRLSSAQSRSLFPPLGSEFAGVHVSGGARIDGRLLAGSLLRAAQRHGATVLRGFARPWVDGGHIKGIDLRRIEATQPDHRLQAVLASETAGTSADGAAMDRIPADRLIVTAGAWADQLLTPLGFAPGVEPQRGQIVHLRLPGTATEEWPVILPPGDHYIVPFDGGRVVAGATRESGSGFDYRVTAAGQAQVLSEALGVAPGLANATVMETRVGFRPLATDARPRLGWISAIAGLAIGNGLGAAGLTIGPLAGRLLADLVLQRPGLLDLAPFDPMRRLGSAGAINLR